VQYWAEANFYRLPKLAAEKYLYMIGDDDLLKQGALSRIVGELRREPDYLIVNYDVYDAALERCVKANKLRVTDNQDSVDPMKCLQYMDGSAMSFLSGWAARREFFNAISEERYRYFAQWGMSIQADRYFGIWRFPKGKLLATPCLKTRQNTDFNDDNFFSWFLHGSAEVFRYAQGEGVLPKEGIRRRKAILLRGYALQRIRYERRKGTFKRQATYSMLRADYGELWSFWLLCVPTMFVPGLGTALTVARRLLGRKDD